MKAKLFKICFLTACILLGVFLGVYFNDRAYFANNGIATGVAVGEISLAGLSPDQARVLLEKEFAPFLSGKLILRYREQSWELDLEKLGPKLELDPVISTAYNLGRDGNLLERSLARLKVRREGILLEPALTLDREQIAILGTKLATELHVSARNARVEVSGDEAYVTSSQTGRRLQTDKLPELFLQAILKKEREVTLPVEEIAPKLTTETVAGWGISKKIAGFSTRFNAENSNRVQNIKLAAAKLDGHIVMPGGEFSFNRIVGTRGVNEGYAEAPVIIGGKLVPGVGGGVCQVSSTLYNTLLLAGLNTTSRSHHSMPVSYLPIGRDAAVAYDYLDLRFKNTTGNALLFKTEVVGDRLRVTVYGTEQKETMDLESVVEEEIKAGIEEKSDSSLAPGERKVIRAGVSGYKVKVWRVVKLGGKVVRRELVSRDYYRPVKEIVAVGPPKKVEAVSVEETEQAEN